MIDHRCDEAVAAFREAAESQENIEFSAYSDPPAWYYPTRRDAAATLYASGDLLAVRRKAEATLVYRRRELPTMALLAWLSTTAQR